MIFCQSQHSPAVPAMGIVCLQQTQLHDKQSHAWACMLRIKKNGCNDKIKTLVQGCLASQLKAQEAQEQGTVCNEPLPGQSSSSVRQYGQASRGRTSRV